MLLVVVATAGLSTQVLAFEPQLASVTDQVCTYSGNNLTGCGSGAALDANGGLLATIMNVIFFIGGLVAVLFIMIGGIQYITATGDSGRIAKAKNTLTYAIVGLVVVLIARGIVGFILGRL